MDLDDLYDDRNDDELSFDELEDIYDDEKILCYMEQVEMEQALIHLRKDIDKNNYFAVDRNYINSKAYHDKFESLPFSPIVRQSLYLQTGRLLDFVNGQEQERMLAIDSCTGRFLVDNFKREGHVYRTGFNAEEKEKIDRCENPVVCIHSHSFNGRPSIQDYLTCLDDEKIKYSLVACHNGNLYFLYDIKPKLRTTFENVLEKKKLLTSDSDEAKTFATTDIYNLNERLPDKRKMFKCKKL